MDYACPVWGNAAGSYILRLQQVQNKALRRIFHVPQEFPAHYLHEAANEPYVIDRLRDIASHFYESTWASANPLVSQLGRPNDERDRYKRPVALVNH